MLNIYLNDHQLVPRSTYRPLVKVSALLRTGHTLHWLHTRNHISSITNITSAERHENALLLCHKLATLMPQSVPYLAITVAILSTGADLSPHCVIRNHRHFRNATISFGKWTGGVLQVYEDEAWVNHDSCEKWVSRDARNTFHRVTQVEGDWLSIIYHTSQRLDRLQLENWEELRRKGLPVDEIYGKEA